MTTVFGRMAFAVLCDEGEAGLEALLGGLPVPTRQVVVVSRSSSPALEAICRRFSVRWLSGFGRALDAEGVNAGAALATDIGADILCVIRSHVRFRTQVISEAAAVLERRPWLGIVAPAAVVVDGSLRGYSIAHRTSWHLGEMRFYRESLAPERDREWYDADFCEFTCAFIRISAFEKVGLCDTAYGSAIAAADFCLRLQDLGYGCACLPSSQIEVVSTFDLIGPITPSLSADLTHFSNKHLGATVCTPDPVGSERIAVLEATLAKYGLRGSNGPTLTVLPRATLRTQPDRSIVLATVHERQSGSSLLVSDINLPGPDGGSGARIAINPGIDTDIFHAWGRNRHVPEAYVFLALVDGWQTDVLTSIRDAWRQCRSTMPGACLQVLGRGLVDAVDLPANITIRREQVVSAQYRDEDIELLEFVTTLDARFLADLLRSVDTVLVPTSGSSVSVAAVLQAEACGAQVMLVAVDPADGLGQPSSSEAKGDSTLLARMAAAWEHRSTIELGSANEDPADRVRSHTWRSRMRSVRHQLAGDHDVPAAFLEGESQRLCSEPAAPSVPSVILESSTPVGSARFTASLVQRLGRSIAAFGAAWEDGGLASASRTAAARAALSVRYRASHLPVLEALRHGRRQRTAPLIDRPLLIGYINGKLGLGESLRGLAQSLITVACPFDIRPVTFGIEDRQMPPVFSDRYDLSHPHRINIVEVSANELPFVMQQLGKPYFDRSYNIFRAWWELERAPEVWRAALRPIHEIWAPNDFVAQAFRAIFDGPITIVPPCVAVPDLPGAPPDPDEPFTFLFSFDFHSSPQRKNPIGVIRAFQEAFANPDLPVRLIVKSTSAPAHHADLRNALRQAVASDRRIVIRDEHLSRPEMLGLLRRADCYVSLHRSEGFGLGMAEAMSLGRPVIGTAYSGNTDFLTEETGYPIGYQLRPLDPGEYVHGEGQRWAEPNHRDAVVAMRRVYQDLEEASQRAEVGRRRVEEQYSQNTVGRVVYNRLKDIPG